MNRFVLLALCAVLAGSCAGRVTLRNRQNLTRLNHGMSKDQVHAVMGRDVRRGVNNPYRTAMYMDKEGHPVEVFYYWTDGSLAGGIDDEELTPLVFRDGMLMGWGRAFWSDFVSKYDLRVQQDVRVRHR